MVSGVSTICRYFLVFQSEEEKSGKKASTIRERNSSPLFNEWVVFYVFFCLYRLHFITSSSSSSSSSVLLLLPFYRICNRTTDSSCVHTFMCMYLYIYVQCNAHSHNHYQIQHGYTAYTNAHAEIHRIVNISATISWTSCNRVNFYRACAMRKRP